MRHVALLRGINVGGKNKLPMQTLAAIFADAGCTDVSTYIQSGNVIFDASAALAKTLPDAIAAAILKKAKLTVPVVVRSAAAIQAVLAHNPFAGKEDAVHVMFLREAPTKGAAAALDRDRSPGDTFQVLGAEIYMHLPNGVARTKLTNAYFDKQLSTVSTLRNWRTVQKLAELAR
jgi:uncharacterized protein (DUF1697 family)